MQAAVRQLEMKILGFSFPVALTLHYLCAKNKNTPVL